jgi:hypothetical protein
VAKPFFPQSAHHRVSLLKLCGGTCATLETLLMAGTPVRKYMYCDPVARQVARFRRENLSAQYPDLFPPSAWEPAFVLPQDITKVTGRHLTTLGRRAAMLHDVARVITMMQLRHLTSLQGTSWRTWRCHTISGTCTSSFLHSTRWSSNEEPR